MAGYTLARNTCTLTIEIILFANSLISWNKSRSYVIIFREPLSEHFISHDTFAEPRPLHGPHLYGSPSVYARPLSIFTCIAHTIFNQEVPHRRCHYMSQQNLLRDK